MKIKYTFKYTILNNITKIIDDTDKRLSLVSNEIVFQFRIKSADFLFIEK